MENQTENQPQQNENTNPNYPDSQSKTSDLMLGCFGGGALLIVIGLILSTLDPQTSLIVTLSLGIIMIIIFVVMKRAYISIGLVLAIVIPLVIFGSCLALIWKN